MHGQETGGGEGQMKRYLISERWTFYCLGGFVGFWSAGGNPFGYALAYAVVLYVSLTVLKWAFVGPDKAEG